MNQATPNVQSKGNNSLHIIYVFHQENFERECKYFRQLISDENKELDRLKSINLFDYETKYGHKTTVNINSKIKRIEYRVNTMSGFLQTVNMVIESANKYIEFSEDYYMGVLRKYEMLKDFYHLEQERHSKTKTKLSLEKLKFKLITNEI